MSEPVQYGLIVAFTDESENFVNGFEMGMLWQRLQTEASDIALPIHTANGEVLTRMAAATGWSVKLEPTEFAEWTNAELSRAKRPALKLVTGGAA